MSWVFEGRRRSRWFAHVMLVLLCLLAIALLALDSLQRASARASRDGQEAHGGGQSCSDRDTPTV